MTTTLRAPVLSSFAELAPEARRKALAYVLQDQEAALRRIVAESRAPRARHVRLSDPRRTGQLFQRLQALRLLQQSPRQLLRFIEAKLYKFFSDGRPFYRAIKPVTDAKNNL
jgi:hypothetical protein